jgi:hypothetical protein
MSLGQHRAASDRSRGGKCLRRFSVSSLVVAAALLGTGAGAATTIGSDLSKTLTFGGYGGTYMGVPTTIPGRLTTAPFDGVIVRWRVRGNGANWGTLTLRVLRRMGASPNTYTGAGTSSAQPIGFVNGTHTFPTELPISAGDYIGLQATNQWQGAAAQPGVSVDYVNPIPSDGGPPSPGLITNSDEPFFNADIEPDCDKDGLGDETQDTDISSCSRAPATCNGIAATIVGTNGNDTLSGTPGRDVIVGLRGRDKLRGLAGNDVICGNESRDTLIGGPGKDLLLGGQGHDRLLGGKGKDTCKGGGGALDRAKSCEKQRSI